MTTDAESESSTTKSRLGDHSQPTTKTANTVWHASSVDRVDRWKAIGSSVQAAGATVWLTGLSGSGKSTIAVELERQLIEAGRPAYLLDGDNLRHGLNGDLGFSADDRAENVRRVAQVARLFCDAGVVAVVPLISPYRAGRELAREIHQVADLPFIEVFVDTPLEICEQRDPKGLYRKARAGELSGMTGIDAPYEAPLTPDRSYTPDAGSAKTIAAKLLASL